MFLSPIQCCATCSADPECEGFTMVGSACYLKKWSNAAPISNEGRVSYKRPYLPPSSPPLPASPPAPPAVPPPVCDYYNATGAHSFAYAESLEAIDGGSEPMDTCCAHCSSLTGCVGFTRAGFTCYFKGGFPTLSTSAATADHEAFVMQAHLDQCATYEVTGFHCFPKSVER